MKNCPRPIHSGSISAALLLVAGLFPGPVGYAQDVPEADRENAAERAPAERAPAESTTHPEETLPVPLDALREPDAANGPNPFGHLIATSDAETEAAVEDGAEPELDADVAEFLAGLDEDLGAAAVPERDPLRIYGFLDVGAQRVFGEDSLGVFLGTSAGTFALGNINLYLDAQPVEGFRGLVEVRFTTLPNGIIPISDASLEPRIDTRVRDLDTPTLADEVPLGSIILERAWIEWNAMASFNLRAGLFLTPYGIWNLDHGLPTLISMVIPDFWGNEFFPIRQLGVQAYGVVPMDDWEFGYHAYVTNGRAISRLDLDDAKAFGGRAFFRRFGDYRLTLGVSAMFDRFREQQAAVLTLIPPVVELADTIKGFEVALGADASLDIGDVRLRAELVFRRIQYDEGFRRPAQYSFGLLEADRWEWSSYLLGAYRIPGTPLEPYLYLGFSHYPETVGDTSLQPSAGVNIHLTPQSQLKIQYLYRHSFDLATERLEESGAGRFHIILSRWTLAF